jgi:hypothetical protein
VDGPNWKRLTRSEDSTFSHRASTAANCPEFSRAALASPLMFTTATEEAIMAVHNIRRFGMAAAATAGIVAMLAGCAPQPASYAVPVAYAAAPAAVPVAYAAAPAAMPVAYAAAPAAYYTQPQAAVAGTPFVPIAYRPAAVPPPAAPRRVAVPAVRHAAARPARSVATSAVIIGSSAGVGAGVGALVGGKKGAGIGALIGGGGAALWDQLTRRR